MCKEKQWNLGRKDSQRLFNGMRRMMCGTWMKLAYFGVLYQIVDLARRVKAVKKSKQRITVAFFVSAAGQKEKPVVIWKSENPRCMQRFNKSCLPVSYYSQKKAWMTGEILEAVLTKLNCRLSSSNCKILLLWIMQVVTLMIWL